MAKIRKRKKIDGRKGPKVARVAPKPPMTEAERRKRNAKAKEYRERRKRDHPKIDPRTGKPYEHPVYEYCRLMGLPPPVPKFGPDGKFIAGDNPIAYQKGMTGKGGAAPRILSRAYGAKLAKVVPAERMVEVDPTDPHGRTYAEFVAEQMIALACNGNIKAATEVRLATEGSQIRNVGESWREELEALGIDPDYGRSRIEELIATLADEAASRGAMGQPDIGDGEAGKGQAQDAGPP